MSTERGDVRRYTQTHSGIHVENGTQLVIASDYDTLRSCYDGLLETGNKILAERDALSTELAEAKAEIERMREDVERYRFLKSLEGHNVYLRRVEGYDEKTVFVYMATKLDSAIDYQRALSPKPIANEGGGT